MPAQTAYAEVERLIRKFKNLSAAARKAYNEDNTRKDFILPLFRALEWDTQDSAQVSAEEKVSRGWVDFSFRIGGVPRFFLETKRMSEDLTRPQWVRQAPIRYINFSDPTDAARHDRVVALVDEMLALQREHAAAARVYDDAREGLARRIAAVDAAIDREVYALYRLTEDEIALVEGQK